MQMRLPFFPEEGLQIDAEEVLQWQSFGTDDKSAGDMLGVEFLELFVAIGIVGTAALDLNGHQSLSLLEDVIAFFFFVIAPIEKFESVQK